MSGTVGTKAGAKTDAKMALSADSKRGIFGIPLADFGLFPSLLLGVTSGFFTFFLLTPFCIAGLAIYNATTHAGISLDHSYKYVSFPAGLAVLVLATGYLMTNWLRRKIGGDKA